MNAIAALLVGSSILSFTVSPKYAGPPLPAVREATDLASKAIVTYFGEFPIQQLEIDVGPHADAEDIFGFVDKTARRVQLSIGSGVKKEALLSDWTLTHEFVHLSFPKIGEQNKWMREGLSTYIEPLARSLAGQADASRLWVNLINRTPDALGPNGETDFGAPLPTSPFQKWISRTYWGGALYWLCVETELYEKTFGKVNLQHVLRGILKKGGTGQVAWTTDKLFNVAKETSGTDVLREQYNRFSQKNQKVNLKAMWTQLGISINASGQLQLDASAPLASLRNSISGITR